MGETKSSGDQSTGYDVTISHTDLFDALSSPADVPLPIEGRVQELPLDQLSWEDFERILTEQKRIIAWDSLMLIMVMDSL